MTALENMEGGQADWLENTKKYCDAALIDQKEAMWNKFFDFSDSSEIKDWGLHHYQHSFVAWNQAAH